ncbi:hypothetical protein [Mycobacterium sp.]|uniref:hypothetical protein n=1 Tax=Mycobacterium sp. TaxID=1785 RepID=UPI003F9B92F3
MSESQRCRQARAESARIQVGKGLDDVPRSLLRDRVRGQMVAEVEALLLELRRSRRYGR